MRHLSLYSQLFQQTYEQNRVNAAHRIRLHAVIVNRVHVITEEVLHYIDKHQSKQRHRVAVKNDIAFLFKPKVVLE